MKVKDVNPTMGGFSDQVMVDVEGTLFFSAPFGGQGLELWKSDGTEEGTVMVKDIWPGTGASVPEWLADVNGTLFFNANNGVNGRELWKSDGTEAGAVMVKDINPGSGCSGRTLRQSSSASS